MESQYTPNQLDKIKKQMAAISRTVEFLSFHREMLQNAILEAIPANAARFRGREQDITWDFTSMPKAFEQAIKATRLHLRLHPMYNVQFEMDLAITKKIGHFISDIYNTLNHVFNLVVFAHPRQVHKRAISDDLKSIMKNKDLLQGALASIFDAHEIWIRDFKEKRKIDEHKSPVEFYITFRVRPETSKATFTLLNNYNGDEIDLFEILGTLDKLKDFCQSVCGEVGGLIARDGGRGGK